MNQIDISFLLSFQNLRSRHWCDRMPILHGTGITPDTHATISFRLTILYLIQFDHSTNAERLNSQSLSNQNRESINRFVGIAPVESLYLSHSVTWKSFRVELDLAQDYPQNNPGFPWIWELSLDPFPYSGSIWLSPQRLPFRHIPLSLGPNKQKKKKKTINWKFLACFRKPLSFQCLTSKKSL